MRRCLLLLVIALLIGCGGKPPSAATTTPATPVEAVTSLGALQLRTTTVAADSLEPAVAQRYGIARSADTWVVLVMLRNARGDAVPDDGLQLTAQAGLLSDPLQPLPLRAIRTDGFVDYIGTLQAKPPTTVRVQLSAQHNGASATQTFSRDLYPR